MLPPQTSSALVNLGLPVSTGRHVGLALVYSATATQHTRVENYGKDKPLEQGYEGKWNGRVIHTIGNQYFEVEEELAKSRETWWGKDNLELAMQQRIITDVREI